MTKPAHWLTSLALVLSSALAQAQGPGSEEVVLTLPEALELAVRSSFELRQAQLDREDASRQVRGAWASVLPRLQGSASYTRTVEAVDPFAGSDAGAAFGSLDAVPWLRFNESARTDDDPATNPISLSEFEQRRAAGLAAIGASPAGGNPFLVENGFFFGLTLTQVLYDPAAFAALDGAKAFEVAADEAVAEQRLATVAAVSRAFYAALLQKERLQVLEKSQERAASNLEDVRARYEAGVLPELQRLTAEVELANRQSDVLRAENRMRDLFDDLRRLVALPPTQRVSVRGQLAYAQRELPSEERALPLALGARPDLARARAVVTVREIDEQASFSALLPRLFFEGRASANGAVPDNRTRIIPSPSADDPFRVSQNELGFFDDAFWFPVVTAAVRLEWTLFDGFANYADIERTRIAAQRSRIAVEQVELQIRIDVERSLRALRTAVEQLETQRRIETLAGRNYDQVDIELRAGEATQFDLRQASQQLDESRFNLLQAIHDYEVAWVDYQVALGSPPIVGE